MVVCTHLLSLLQKGKSKSLWFPRFVCLSAFNICIFGKQFVGLFFFFIFIAVTHDKHDCLYFKPCGNFCQHWLPYNFLSFCMFTFPSILLSFSVWTFLLPRFIPPNVSMSCGQISPCDDLPNDDFSSFVLAKVHLGKHFYSYKIYFYVAPWLSLGLPSCGPGFESQAHQMLFSICIVEIVMGMRKGRK